ncbi:MAG: transporter, partial [Hyphomicrobiales bacterium]
MQAWIYTLIPAAAAILGAAIAANLRPGAVFVSAIQHLAAGVVFAAAAGEILPDLKHVGSPWATLVGGAVGVAAMLGVRMLERRAAGPVGLLTVTGIDILVDGLVLGIAFASAARAGFLLTVA